MQRYKFVFLAGIIAFIILVPLSQAADLSKFLDLDTEDLIVGRFLGVLSADGYELNGTTIYNWSEVGGGSATVNGTDIDTTGMYWGSDTYMRQIGNTFNVTTTGNGFFELHPKINYGFKTVHPDGTTYVQEQITNTGFQYTFETSGTGRDVYYYSSEDGLRWSWQPNYVPVFEINNSAVSVLGNADLWLTDDVCLNNTCIDDWDDVNQSGGSSVSFGTVGQIPFTNSATDDFDYGNFSYNGTALILNQSDNCFYMKDGNYSFDTHICKYDNSTRDSMALRVNTVKNPGSQFQASGGNITYEGGYTYHAFYENGTFTPIAGASNIEVLVVGGGGSGGGCDADGGGGGGGGAGGINYTSALYIDSDAVGAITVTIGSGGAIAYSVGNNGTNSSFGDYLVAAGGGAGAYTPSSASQPGNSGGSGGGSVKSGTPGYGISGQGYNGGSGTSTYPYGGGGGGGASEVGNTDGAPYSQRGGFGGDGTYYASFSSFGDSGYFAGGGGGGIRTGTAGGTGGQGGGGDGGFKYNGYAGTANTGGGGGGHGSSGVNRAGGAGGSGIVIVRYETPVSNYEETIVWNSTDGTLPNERGTQIFGDGQGRTVLDGRTIRLNLDGVESGYMNESGIFSLPKQSYVSGYLGTNQNIPDVTYTKVEFDTEEYDVQGEFDSTTDYRFTPQETGVYMVTFKTTIDDLLDGDFSVTSIYKNGVNYRYDATRLSGNNYYTHGHVSTHVYLDAEAGDYIEFYVYHNEGNTQVLVAGSTVNWFSIAKVA